LFNSRSLKNKISDLQCFLTVELPEIVCITETWLSADVLNCSIVGDLPFTVFRADRVDSSYGGVCIITRDCAAKAVQLEVRERFIKTEVVAIDILNVLNPIRIIAIYRSPSADTDADAVSEIKLLIKCLKRLCDVNRSVVITGDLNLPCIDWNEPNLVSDHYCCSVMFATFACQNTLDQHVKDFTRPSTSACNTGSLIDIVLCNDSHIIHNVNVIAPFSTSDHCIVEFELSFLPLKGDSSHCFPVDVNYRNFNSCDWDAVNNYLFNVDWQNLFANCHSAEQHADIFYSVINDCIDQFVPLNCSRRKNKFHGVHYPQHIRKLLLKKKTCWRLYRKFGTAAYLTRYKLVSSQCRKAIFFFIQNREDALISTGNLGKFYRYANSKLNCRTNVGSLRQANGILTI